MGIIVFKDVLKPWEDTLGRTQINEFSDGGSQSDRTKPRQDMRTWQAMWQAAPLKRGLGPSAAKGVIQSAGEPEAKAVREHRN